jgi:hypothetical protein
MNCAHSAGPREPKHFVSGETPKDERKSCVQTNHG